MTDFDTRRTLMLDDYLSGEYQRHLAGEDMRFCNVEGGHWEGDWIDREDGRPKLQYDLTSDYLTRFLGEWAQNRVTVDFRAGDGPASSDDADLLAGLFRRDRRQGGGQIAEDMAVLELINTGMGAFRLKTEFVDDEDAEIDDQRIVWEPLYSAFSTVIWDVAAKMPDKSDARHVTVLFEYPSRESFAEAYPERGASSLEIDDERWRTAFRNRRRQDSVVVAEYYEKKTKKVDVMVFGNPATGETRTLTESEALEANDLDGWNFIRKRKVRRTTIKKSIFDGQGDLEAPRVIPGKHLPVVVMYGNRAYVDGQESYKGLVRDLKDPQRLFDLEISQVAELSDAQTRQIPIFDPSQIDAKTRRVWEEEHLSQVNYLLANVIRDKSGNVTHAGPTGFLPQPQMDAHSHEVLALTQDFMRQKTGGNPQDTADPDASGKAILAMQKRVDMNTAWIVEGIRTGLKRGGEVYRGLVKDVYKTTRRATAINVDGSERDVVLNQPTLDEAGNPSVKNDITKGNFEVITDTGPSFDSQREAAFEQLKDLMVGVDPSASPEIHSALMNALLMNIDGPGTDPIRDLARRNMITTGLMQPETDEEIAMVEQMQAEDQEPDPNDALLAAVEQQTLAETEESKAAAQQKMSSAALNMAKVAEIKSNIQRQPGIDATERIAKLTGVRSAMRKA